MNTDMTPRWQPVPPAAPLSWAGEVFLLGFTVFHVLFPLKCFFMFWFFVVSFLSRPLMGRWRVFCCWGCLVFLGILLPSHGQKKFFFVPKFVEASDYKMCSESKYSMHYVHCAIGNVFPPVLPAVLLSWAGKLLFLWPLFLSALFFPVFLPLTVEQCFICFILFYLVTTVLWGYVVVVTTEISKVFIIAL